MGLKQEEIICLNSDISEIKAYNAMKDHLINFSKKWEQLNQIKKSNYKFGDRVGNIQYVDASIEYINSLKSIPEIGDIIDLAKNIIYQKCEYCYNEVDFKSGIKIGAYAHYVIDKFNT